MRYKVFALYLLVPFVFFVSSCNNDYKEEGIEGRWQLREMKVANEGIIQVDTVFYSFKKDVFEYLILKKPTQYFHIFGNYKIMGETLSIEIDKDSFEPKDQEHNFDWGTYQKSFMIKEHTSSKLQLEANDTIYYFRKH